MTVLDRLNNSLQNALRQVEHIGADQDAVNRISSMMEILLAELNTELSFSSHLSKITDKMNQRLTNQEKSIAELRRKLSDALNELTQSKEKCLHHRTSIEVLESSNKTLNAKLDQLNSTLAVTKSLQSRDKKTLSEQQSISVHCCLLVIHCLATIKTLTDSSEVSKVVLKKLKHQEEMVRLKNLDLEGKIDALQQQLDLKTRELLESERSVQVF